MTRCFMVASIEEGFIAGSDRPDNFNVGAMFWWSHGRHTELDTAPRPMPHLAVMTPAGLACLDCPATGGSRAPGRYWERTGEPPEVTAAPSLDIGEGSPFHWHGWLQSGELRG